MRGIAPLARIAALVALIAAATCTLITASKRTFDATASCNDALPETIRIFPTFLDESKATLARLETFSTNTRPLVQDLRPVARELKPTLADLRALGPTSSASFATSTR